MTFLHVRPRPFVIAYSVFSLVLMYIYWSVSGSVGYLSYVTKDQAETVTQFRPVLKDVVEARKTNDEVLVLCMQIAPQRGSAASLYTLQIPLRVLGAEIDGRQVPSARSTERDLDQFLEAGYRHFGRIGYQATFPWKSLAEGCDLLSEMEAAQPVFIGEVAPFDQNFDNYFPSNRNRPPELELLIGHREMIYSEVEYRSMNSSAFVYAMAERKISTDARVSNYFVFSIDGERSYPNRHYRWVLPATALIDFATAPIQLIGFGTMLAFQIFG